MAAMSTLGAGLGAMQWIVVRGRLEGAKWWAPTTVAVWSVAGAVIGTLVGALNGRLTAGAHDAGLIGVVITVSLSLLALGFIPATCQWLILRGGLRSLAWYSLRHAAGLVAGGVALWVPASSLGLNLPSGSAWAVGGIALGACIGLATARPVARPLRLARDSGVSLTAIRGWVHSRGGIGTYWTPMGVISLGRFSSGGIPSTRVGGGAPAASPACLITNKPLQASSAPEWQRPVLKGLGIYR